MPPCNRSVLPRLRVVGGRGVWRACAVAALLLCAMPAFGARLAAQPQRRQPVPATDAEQRLLNDANELHDHQDVDAAIERYQLVLKSNPDNVEAMLELATCYLEKAERESAVVFARRGMAYESDYFGHFAMILGNAYDALSLPDSAVAAYRAGLAVEPRSFLLHYNLGVTLLGMKRFADAAAAFEAALLLNPNHAASHLGLGPIHVALGNRLPALLALLRGLVLEPASERADMAVRRLRQILAVGTRDQAPLKWRKPPKASVQYAAWQAMARFAPTRAGGDELATVQQRLGAVLAAVAESGREHRNGDFVARYYFPYFTALHQRGYLQPLVYWVMQSVPGGDREEWARVNEARIAEFLEFSREYDWGGGER